MKKDIFYPTVLCVLLLTVICLNYYFFGNFLYDCGREFLVPKEMAGGLLPVKDIFLSYFPLSYEINTALFAIFGANLDTLRGAGIFCSLSIGILIYFCAREFLPPEKSFLAAVSTVFITFFNISHLFNYVMGYSYAFIYGIAFMFLSIFLTIKYIKTGKHLYLAFLAAGFCLALKIEFIFIFPAYIFVLLYKKAGIKNLMCCTLVFLVPLILSFAVLFPFGFSFSNFTEYFGFLVKFLNSEVLKTYNSNVFHLPAAEWISINLKSFIEFLKYFASGALILYFPFCTQKKRFIIPAVFLTFVVFFILALSGGHFGAHELFLYLCVTTFLILVAGCKRKNPVLIFLAVLSLGIAARFNFIYKGGYCAYILPAALFLNIVFFANKSRVFLPVLSILAFLNVFYYSLSNRIATYYPVQSKVGKMYLHGKGEGEVINKTLNFMKNIQGGKEVLILPEGAMFNFYADKKTNMKYHQLLPNHIEILGEDSIISDLAASPPDYIFILNTDYKIYGTPYFCDDFGQKICEFVKTNYIPLQTYNKEGFSVKIFTKFH